MTIARLRGRRPEVLDDLLGRYGREMQAVAYLVLRDRAAAEDAVAEALLIALDRGQDLRDDEALRPWLLRIATNRAVRAAADFDQRLSIAAPWKAFERHGWRSTATSIGIHALPIPPKQLAGHSPRRASWPPGPGRSRARLLQRRSCLADSGRALPEINTSRSPTT